MTLCLALMKMDQWFTCSRSSLVSSLLASALIRKAGEWESGMRLWLTQPPRQGNDNGEAVLALRLGITLVLSHSKVCAVVLRYLRSSISPSRAVGSEGIDVIPSVPANVPLKLLLTSCD